MESLNIKTNLNITSDYFILFLFILFLALLIYQVLIVEYGQEEIFVVKAGWKFVDKNHYNLFKGVDVRTSRMIHSI